MQLQNFKNRKINLKEDINFSIAYTKESKAKKINNSARIRLMFDKIIILIHI